MVFQGSKTKYCKEIIPILQKYYDSGKYKGFIDAMCGGCNVIDKIKSDNKIAYDIDAGLIDLYHRIQQPEYDFPETITRDMWNSCKNTPNDNPPWLVALVAYFTSYSARGFNGGFAMNGKRDFYTERLNNFKKQIPLLQDIHFETKDLYDLDCEGYMIYIDPPYKDTKPYDSSEHFDHYKFWEKVRELSKNNLVIVSEQNAPDDFNKIWSRSTSRNCFGSELYEATENLFIWNEGQEN